ncbi:autotransporter outer membrane beta-barrel domain-containing protein [Schlesneria paludicola]|uniref:autotransporter outer membrane beta-barrel domain-containing protein n=1 Tax=Schlesneria paludicola TaxID=360056 RepID=UPI00029A0A3A|nr:autotransporter domain-containing protein [Schlesneria paludicola]
MANIRAKSHVNLLHNTLLKPDRASAIVPGRHLADARGRRLARACARTVCLAILSWMSTAAAMGQSINVGTSVDFNAAIQTINSNPTTAYTLNLTSGFTMGQQSPDFASNSNITLTGNTNTIDGAGSYQPLIIDSGTVTLQNLSITNTGQPTMVNGGTLVDKTGSLQGDVINNGAVAFNTSDSFTYTGDMSGTGSVLVTGTGTITFNGSNSYTGGTTVDAYTTLVGTTDSIQGNIVDNGVVTFNQSTAGTYAGAISGAGSVVISGTGAVTFTGANNYYGGTTISQGSTLIGSTDSLLGVITNGGTLKIDQATTGTLAGNVIGTGSVVIGGGGTVNLIGANFYSGGTTLTSGTTVIGNTDGIQGNFVNNGSVTIDQNAVGTYRGNMSGAGSMTLTGGGTITFTGVNSYTGGTSIGSGTTLIGSTSSLQGNIDVNGLLKVSQVASGTLSSNISGNGSVEINGAISMTGHNSYLGGTTVDAGGSLTGTSLAVQGNIVNNGSVTFQNMNALIPGGGGGVVTPAIVIPGMTSFTNTYSGNMSGTGSVHLTAGGPYSFFGTNTYTGGTTVDANALLYGNTNSIQGNIVNNGLVEISQGTNGTYAGNMSGTGGVGIGGGGTFTLSGTNTYLGGTTLGSLTTLIGTTNSLQGPILNDGTVRFDQTTSGTFAGAMNGAGKVEISGTGPVTFSGTNGYSGGTTINTGSILIGTTNSLQGAITNNGTVRFSQSASGAYLGNMTGTGHVDINGSGTVGFFGTNTYTGGTSINNGATLYIGGTTSGSLDVNNGGTLRGYGAVGSTFVHAGGTIAPNILNEPQVTFAPIYISYPLPTTSDPTAYSLKIDGHFTQGTGSTYTTALSAQGNDQIKVTGAAEIQDGARLNVVVDSGTYTVGKKYDILTAGDGISGKYSTVAFSSFNQHIEFVQVYSQNDLTLVVNSTLAGSATSANQLAIARAIDQSSGVATGDYANAVTQLTLLNGGALTGALNQLSGGIYPNLGTIERQTTTVEMQLLSNRLAGLSGPGIPPVNVAQRPTNVRLVSRQMESDPTLIPGDGRVAAQGSGWTTWGQGFGLGGSLNGDGNGSGVNYRLGGTLFGIERWLGERTLVGVLGGYSYTSLHDRQDSSNANINGFQVGLYELHRAESLYLSNIDAFGNNQYDVTRPINFGNVSQTATGSMNGNRWSHYTEAGMTFEADEIRIQPFIGLQYMYLDQGGMTESGAGTLNLSTDHQSISSVRNNFGVRAYQEATWGNTLVIPSISASYQHEWGNGTQLVTSSLAGAPTVQFTTAGTKVGRDFGLFTLGGTAFLTDNLSVYGLVDAQVASNYFAVIGSGGVQYAW